MLLDFLDHARIRICSLLGDDASYIAQFQLVRIFLNVSGCCSVCLCLHGCWFRLYIMLVMCCACVHGALHLHNININAWGPNPSGVTVSPNGCQSLQVTWTHCAPTPPLILIHYRLRYQTQGGSVQAVTTTSQGSYTLTDLAPATTYKVIVDAQTQLGYGSHCCVPTAMTHNGEAFSDGCTVTRWLWHLAVYYYVTITVSGINMHSSVLMNVCWCNSYNMHNSASP